MITNRRLVNPRILGIMLVAASLLIVTSGSQDAMAQGGATEDVIVEEVVEAEAGNATMAAGGTNQTSEPTFLSIQHAQSGSISELNATAYTLELNDVSDKTILFSDRPDRIVTSVTTADFVGNWTAGAESFAADPPNAVLALADGDTVIELYYPIYDSDVDTLTYDIIPLNLTSLELPSKFGQSTLVIDVIEHSQSNHVITATASP